MRETVLTVCLLTASEKPLKRFLIIHGWVTGLKPGVNERGHFQTFEEGRNITGYSVVLGFESCGAPTKKLRAHCHCFLILTIHQQFKDDSPRERTVLIIGGEGEVRRFRAGTSCRPRRNSRLGDRT
jgi:hypothetical protein